MSPTSRSAFLQCAWEPHTYSIHTSLDHGLWKAGLGVGRRQSLCDRWLLGQAATGSTSAYLYARSALFKVLPPSGFKVFNIWSLKASVACTPGSSGCCLACCRSCFSSAASSSAWPAAACCAAIMCTRCRTRTKMAQYRCFMVCWASVAGQQQRPIALQAARRKRRSCCCLRYQCFSATRCTGCERAASLCRIQEQTCT